MSDIDPHDQMESEYNEIRDEFDFGFIVVGLFLVLSVLYCAGLIGGEPPKGEPIEEDDRVTPYTIEEIKKYDGKNHPDGLIYIGCNGFVFDVTKSANFQEGGMYGNFAGNDISMACAYYSTDDKYLGQIYDPENNNLKFSQ